MGCATSPPASRLVPGNCTTRSIRTPTCAHSRPYRGCRSTSGTGAEAFVIVSNDSDLTEPMRIVCHELGMVVGILNPQPPQKRSRALLSCKPTFFKQIRAGVLAASQFPPTLTDSTGTITKPTDW